MNTETTSTKRTRADRKLARNIQLKTFDDIQKSADSTRQAKAAEKRAQEVQQEVARKEWERNHPFSAGLIKVENYVPPTGNQLHRHA